MFAFCPSVHLPLQKPSVSFTITSSELYIVTLFKIFSPYPSQLLFFYSICSGSIVFQLELFLTLHPPKSPAPLWCCFLFLRVLHMPCSLVITLSPLSAVTCHCFPARFAHWVGFGTLFWVCHVVPCLQCKREKRFNELKLLKIKSCAVASVTVL